MDELIDEYNAECQRRSTQAAAASRRTALQERVTQRQIAETQFERSSDLRRGAAAAVVAAAATVGLTDSNVGDGDLIEQASGLVPRLESWQRERVAKIGELDGARTRWQQLQALLDGSSLDQLRDELTTATQAFETLSDEVAHA